MKISELIEGLVETMRHSGPDLPVRVQGMSAEGTNLFPYFSDSPEFRVETDKDGNRVLSVYP